MAVVSTFQSMNDMQKTPLRPAAGDVANSDDGTKGEEGFYYALARFLNFSTPLSSSKPQPA